MTFKIVGERHLAAGKFLNLRLIDYLDDNGDPRTWEAAGRVNSQGAVLLIPRFEPDGGVLLIRQFRAPHRRLCHRISGRTDRPRRNPGKHRRPRTVRRNRLPGQDRPDRHPELQFPGTLRRTDHTGMDDHRPPPIPGTTGIPPGKHRIHRSIPAVSGRDRPVSGCRHCPR